jgi:hypothetical protein
MQPGGLTEWQRDARVSRPALSYSIRLAFFPSLEGLNLETLGGIRAETLERARQRFKTVPLDGSECCTGK